MFLAKKILLHACISNIFHLTFVPVCDDLNSIFFMNEQPGVLCTPHKFIWNGANICGSPYFKDSHWTRVKGMILMFLSSKGYGALQGKEPLKPHQQGILKKSKLTDLEDLSRHNIFKISRIPESIQSSQLPHYVRDLFLAVVPSILSADLTFDRIHRVPKPFICH